MRKPKYDRLDRKTVDSKDISEQMKQLYRSIMENAYIGFTLIDRNHKIVMVNSVVSRYAQKPASELIGRQCFREFEKRESVCPHCPGTQAMETGQAVEIETERIRDNGKHFPVRIQALPTIGPDGTVSGFIEIIENIIDRKKTEQALRESEERYRSFVQNLDGIAYRGNVNFEPEFFHGAVEKMTGYTEQDFMERKIRWDSIIHKDDLPGYLEKVKKIIHYKPLVAESKFRIVHRNGSIRWIHEIFQTLFDDSGQVIGSQGIQHDITERKKAEDALRKSEKKYKDLFENAREAIVTVDLEGRITEVNKLVEEYGFKREKLIGKKLFEFVPDYDRARSVSDFDTLIGGNPVKGEMDVITPKGIFTVEYRDNPIVRAGEVIGVQIILTDITERKRTEQLLRKERDKAQKYLDVAAVMMVAIDSEQRVGLINRKGCEILGYSEDEILGKNWFDNFLPEGIRGEVRDIFEKTVRGEIGPLGYYENPVLTKSRQERLIAWHNTILRDEKGEVIGTLSSGEDITEQRRAVDALQRSEKQASAAIEAARALTFNYDIATGKVNWGGATEQITGYTPEEFAEIDVDGWAERLHPNDKDRVLSILQEAIQQKDRATAEYRFKTKKGYITLSSISLTERKNGKAVRLVGILQDVTERKKAEEALRESEEKVSQIVQENSVATFVIDNNHIITHWNKACESLTGFSPNEMIGTQKQWLAFYFEKRPVLVDLIADNASEKDIIRYYGGKYRKSTLVEGAYEAEDFFPHLGERGKWLFFTAAPLRDSQGKVTGAIETLQDITMRKEAEEQIAKLAKFPAEDPHPILRISAFGTVMYSNKAGLPLLKTWQCRAGESLPDRWYRLVLDCLSSGQSEQIEIQCDGRTFSLTFAPIVDANYVNVYGLDITERKQAEQKLLDYQSQLKSLASQLTLAEERERRRIATNLHDRIGQTLAIAKVKLDGMRHCICPTETNEVLTEICSLLGQAIADVRSLTFDLSSPILHELGLEAAIEAWLTEEIEQKYDIAVELEKDKTPKPLDDDLRTFLFRDVRELLINVVKHSQATKVKVSIRSVGEQICISVEDDGMGFDTAEVTAKAVRKGGFGLFSIRERLEQFGGHLQIESSPGCGCKVTIMAPLKEAKIINGG